MSSLQSKKLLLLTTLEAHHAHGYALNQLLRQPWQPVRIGKSNAYRILEKMEKEGWVAYHKERSGNRPDRRVYAITPSGRKECKRLLRQQLAMASPMENPDCIALNMISSLKPEESIPLLEEKMQRLAERCSTFDMLSDDIRAIHPGMDLMRQQAHIELEFTRTLIDRIKTTERE